MIWTLPYIRILKYVGILLGALGVLLYFQPPNVAHVDSYKADPAYQAGDAYCRPDLLPRTVLPAKIEALKKEIIKQHCEDDKEVTQEQYDVITEARRQTALYDAGYSLQKILFHFTVFQTVVISAGGAFTMWAAWAAHNSSKAAIESLDILRLQDRPWLKIDVPAPLQWSASLVDKSGVLLDFRANILNLGHSPATDLHIWTDVVNLSDEEAVRSAILPPPGREDNRKAVFFPSEPLTVDHVLFVPMPLARISSVPVFGVVVGVRYSVPGLTEYRESTLLYEAHVVTQLRPGKHGNIEPGIHFTPARQQLVSAS